MEEDFEQVARYIHEAIEITKFILTKLDGGAKAPLKVSFLPVFNQSRVSLGPLGRMTI